MRFTIRHLQWIPHFLTAEQKQIRVNMVREPLHFRSAQSGCHWHDILT
jgi:hypothetical protein